MSTEQVLELDTSTVKSIINDIVECSDSVAKIIKETMQSSDVTEENMGLIIQEIVSEKTTDVKVKFVEVSKKTDSLRILRHRIKKQEQSKPFVIKSK